MDKANYFINSIREKLSELPDVTEKSMFQCVSFMVDDKLCIGVRKDALLCRIGHQQADAELAQDQSTPMIHNGRTMKDFVFVDLESLTGNRQLSYWIDLCLKFNPIAKASKKKK